MVDSKKNNLQIVVLNTNLWYSSNKKINTTVDSDPGGQFAFLESILERAVDDDLKVNLAPLSIHSSLLSHCFLSGI